jgi:RNA polymerase sigma factor (sigma-70 family)
VLRGGTLQRRNAMTRGDELAEHHPWLRRLARRFARSRARADDLVQDTCLTALHNAPPDAQLRPWLRATMRKVAWGQVRSERRRAQREEGFSLIAPAVTVPEALLDYRFERERLAEALALLPEPFRSTIAQRFLHGRSCAEIARSENIPAGTVRWRQARWLELLRTGMTPPRRKRAIWALPLLGVGKLAEHMWRAISVRGGSGKALWLWLAFAAVIYAIHGGDGAHLLQRARRRR